MRLAAVRVPTGVVPARVDGDVLRPLAAASVVDALARLAAGEPVADAATDPLAGTAALDCPVGRPGKIICVGHNYLGHIREMGRTPPEFPTLFAKFADALLGPTDPLVLPPESAAVDWEAELGIVVGRVIRRGDVTQARAAIGGYTVANDVSMRDWQRRTTQFLQGKTFEATTPVGPVIVTPDEVDHARDLRITCTVDDVTMQDGRTSDMLFDPATIVAYLSGIVTLRPGDLILTGTPAGVGDGRDPKLFLRPGQVLRTQIEGIGACVNTCVGG